MGTCKNCGDTHMAKISRIDGSVVWKCTRMNCGYEETITPPRKEAKK